MSQHNGYKTLNEHSTLAQLHPSTAPLASDEYGLTPDYLIYTSLVATARVFLSKVGICCHIALCVVLHAAGLVVRIGTFSVPSGGLLVFTNHFTRV